MSETQYARIITKASTGTATIPPSADHSNGDWISTDIYEHELYIDDATGDLYTNIGGVITQLNPSSPDTNFANTNLTFAANRSHNVAGYTLTIGATGVGQPMVLTAVNGNGLSTSSTNGNGVFASSTNGYAGEFYATNDVGIYSEGGNIGIQGIGTGSGQGGLFSSGSGIALTAASSSGMGLHVIGAGYIESNGVGGTPATDAVFEANSTTQGALLPRMTTTQRDAIGTPATGLEIYNTTTNRKEVYNGTYWAGDRQTVNIFHSGYNPVDATTPFFGANTTLVPQTAGAFINAFNISLRGSGVIRACTFVMFIGGAVGTSENISLHIRHNSTDYLVATVGNTNLIRVFENTSLNIPYVDGDVIKMYYTNPTWVTNPIGVQGQGTITLQ